MVRSFKNRLQRVMRVHPALRLAARPKGAAGQEECPRWNEGLTDWRGFGAAHLRRLATADRAQQLPLQQAAWRRGMLE